MRADWYSATLTEGPDVVLPALLQAQDLSSLESIPGMHSFDRGVELKRGSRSLAKAFWGGVNGDSVHLQGSGSEAPWVVSFAREQFPDHRVSRFDACEDYSGDGAWDSLSGIALGVADLCSVKVRHQGDWHRGVDGRTLYLGGRTSIVQARVYEKGKQLQRDPNWVRVEVQVRPKGSGKALLSRAQPSELMGCSRWTSELGTRLGQGAVSKLEVRDPWQESDEHRAVRWMVKQYGQSLEAVALERGSWSALGVYLEGLFKQVREISDGEI